MTRSGSARTLAWALGRGAAAACILGGILCLGLGADSVGEALALAAHLAFKPLAGAH